MRKTLLLTVLGISGCGISDHAPPTAEMPYSYPAGPYQEPQTAAVERDRDARHVERLMETTTIYRRIRGEWPANFPALLNFAQERRITLSGAAFQSVEFKPEDDGSVIVKYQPVAALKPTEARLTLER